MMIYVVVLADKDIFIFLQYHPVSISTVYCKCNALPTLKICFISAFPDLLRNITLVRVERKMLIK